MKTEKELAIDEVAVLTNALNYAIKEAWEVGLSINVTTHTGKIQVDVKEIK